MDLAKIFEATDITFHTNALGPLRIGTISGATINTLRQRFPNLDQVDSEQFVRAFLAANAYHASADGTSRELQITDEEAETLPQVELERFAETYINEDDHLFRDIENPKRVEKQQPDGKSIVSYQYDTINVPRNTEEDSLSYLKRLVIGYLRRHESSVRKTFDRIVKPVSLFNDTASNLLRENLFISRNLDQSLSQIVTPKFPNFEILPNPIDKTNEQLHLVVVQLRSMAPVLTDSAHLIRNMNDLALSMATNSAAHAERVQRQNRFMIGIAVTSLVVSAVFSVLTYIRDGQKDAVNSEIAKSLSIQVELSRAAYVSMGNSINSRLDDAAAIQDLVNKTMERIANKLDSLTPKQIKKAKTGE